MLWIGPAGSQRSATKPAAGATKAHNPVSYPCLPGPESP